MRFKTLRHKTLPDTYGLFEIEGKTLVAYTGMTPALMPMTASLEAFLEYITQFAPNAPEALQDYEMVEVEVLVVENSVTNETNT